MINISYEFQKKIFKTEANTACELCKATENLNIYTVQPSKKIDLTDSVYACQTRVLPKSKTLISLIPTIGAALTTACASEFLPVQIIAWRMLKSGYRSRMVSRLVRHDVFGRSTIGAGRRRWATAWRKRLKLVHRDVNGVILEAGDSVVLIKDFESERHQYGCQTRHGRTPDFIRPRK